MKAGTPELRGFDAAGFVEDPDTWQPEDDEVIFWLYLSLGFPGEEAAELYSVAVATPAGLRTETWRRARREGRREPEPIVLPVYSWEGVLSEIRRRLDAAASHRVLEAREKLRRLFHWEFEGMFPDPAAWRAPE